MRSGSSLIPPAANADRIVTLIALRALVGPLPGKLASYASKQEDFSKFIKKKWTLTKEFNIMRMLISENVECGSYINWIEKGSRIRNQLTLDMNVDGKEFKDLVLEKALVLDPDKRITARKALEHKYFALRIPVPTPPEHPQYIKVSRR